MKHPTSWNVPRRKMSYFTKRPTSRNVPITEGSCHKMSHANVWTEEYVHWCMPDFLLPFLLVHTGRYVAWDILWHGTFWDVGHLLMWGILLQGSFMMDTFCGGTFCFGMFCLCCKTAKYVPYYTANKRFKGFLENVYQKYLRHKIVSYSMLSYFYSIINYWKSIRLRHFDFFSW